LPVVVAFRARATLFAVAVAFSTAVVVTVTLLFLRRRTIFAAAFLSGIVVSAVRLAAISLLRFLGGHASVTVIPVVEIVPVSVFQVRPTASVSFAAIIPILAPLPVIVRTIAMLVLVTFSTLFSVITARLLIIRGITPLVLAAFLVVVLQLAALLWAIIILLATFSAWFPVAAARLLIIRGRRGLPVIITPLVLAVLAVVLPMDQGRLAALLWTITILIAAVLRVLVLATFSARVSVAAAQARVSVVAGNRTDRWPVGAPVMVMFILAVPLRIGVVLVAARLSCLWTAPLRRFHLVHIIRAVHTFAVSTLGCSIVATSVGAAVLTFFMSRVIAVELVLAPEQVVTRTRQLTRTTLFGIATCGQEG
jgi:hypothetical protein